MSASASCAILVRFIWRMHWWSCRFFFLSYLVLCALFERVIATYVCLYCAISDAMVLDLICVQFKSLSLSRLFILFHFFLFIFFQLYLLLVYINLWCLELLLAGWMWSGHFRCSFICCLKLSIDIYYRTWIFDTFWNTSSFTDPLVITIYKNTLKAIFRRFVYMRHTRTECEYHQIHRQKIANIFTVSSLLKLFDSQIAKLNTLFNGNLSIPQSTSSTNFLSHFPIDFKTSVHF